METSNMKLTFNIYWKQQFILKSKTNYIVTILADVIKLVQQGKKSDYLILFNNKTVLTNKYRGYN